MRSQQGLKLCVFANDDIQPFKLIIDVNVSTVLVCCRQSQDFVFFSVWGSIQGFDDGWTRECAMDKRDSAYYGVWSKSRLKRRA